MRTFAVLLVIQLVTSYVLARSLQLRSGYYNLNCEVICTSRHEHDESDAAHCGCPHNLQRQNNQSHPLPDQHSSHTLSMCDYLCSIQMGGAACVCSAPIVPGRK
ncbi:hypothetical protein DPMN_074502 [Dreissena polymorpha]|uniref:Uncharacterized protein n=1 Tax=Dreissena polymorpha TaxID=45954 RepID=A0A9D4BKQ3_DREPO|nr:hypothetical protein DPMN_074502 [Dreissena polymorpha]